MAEMFIGGQEVAFPELERFPVVNPATGEVVDTVPLASEREVDLAVRAAHEAFPSWWDTPAARRGEILYAALEKVRAHAEELARTLTLEQGKPLREARLEIRRFLHTIEHYAGLAKNLRGGYVPSLDLWAGSQAATRGRGRYRALELPHHAARQQAGPSPDHREHRGS